MKLIFAWIHLSISRAGAFGERQKSPYCITIIPESPKSNALSRHFFQRTHLANFWMSNDYCSALSDHSVWICGGTKRLGRSMPDDICPYPTFKILHSVNEHYDECIIAQDFCKHTGSVMDYPPYLPDLTPYDIFLCVCVRIYRRWSTWKDEVYRQNSRMAADLKQKICAACETIQTVLLLRISANSVVTLHRVVAANGGYIEKIVIKFL